MLWAELVSKKVNSDVYSGATSGRQLVDGWKLL